MMSANLVFLIAVAFVLIVMPALMTVAVKSGLKWAKIADVSFLKAFGLYLLLVLVNGMVSLCAMFAHSFAPDKLNDLVMNCVECAIELMVPCLVVAFIYKVRLLRAALGVFPFFVCGFAIVALIFVERAYIYEAFSIPTNSMAPTLLGEHLEAPCPRCGAPAYGPRMEAGRQLPPEGWQMICSKEMKSVYVTNPPKIEGGGDRMFVCKLLKPKRWDLIAFRNPQNPSESYVKRLVGLPGEKLEIRDGAIWINGEKQEPPEAIRGIHFSPTIENNGRVFSGLGSAPVQLKSGEYFVLGDFVEQAADSRLWEQGAPGYPPYAVPESHVIGVAINIYWPISRWTGFR
jgi:signal peptidase I